MTVVAVYEDGDGDEARAELKAVAYSSTQAMYAQISTSTTQGAVGHNAVLHLKSNFFFEVFQYVVSDGGKCAHLFDPACYDGLLFVLLQILSKGVVVYNAQEVCTKYSKMVTFTVPISVDMIPSFKVVVSIVSPTGDLIADSVTIPVESINRYKVYTSYV